MALKPGRVMSGVRRVLIVELVLATWIAKFSGAVLSSSRHEATDRSCRSLAFLVPSTDVAGRDFRKHRGYSLASGPGSTLHQLRSQRSARRAWPPVPALNPGSSELLRLAVWTDFQLAVLFFVLTPLALLGAGIWASLSTGGKRDKVLRLISGYWQCSSMLLVTVLLNIGAMQVSAVTGLLAQVMILVSLWFWEDLTESINMEDGAVASAVRTWRLIATAIAAAGVAANVPFQYCATVPSLAADAGCAAWIEAPLAFRDLLLPGLGQDLSGQIGLLALTIYVVYLAYFVSFIVPIVGRRGLAQRPSFTWLSPLEWLGLVSPRTP